MNISNCIKKSGLLFLLMTNNLSVIYAENNLEDPLSEQTEQKTIIDEKQEPALDTDTKQKLNLDDKQGLELSYLQISHPRNYTPEGKYSLEQMYNDIINIGCGLGLYPTNLIKRLN